MGVETLVREWAESCRSRGELEVELRNRYGMILYGLLSDAGWAGWTAALEREQAAKQAVLDWAASHSATEAA